MQVRCKQVLVAVFGPQKVDEFPEPLLKLMEQLYGIAHKDGSNQNPPEFDNAAYHEGLERGYYQAREELVHQMDKEVAYRLEKEVAHRLEDERRWHQQQALQMKMAPASAASLGLPHGTKK